MSPMHVIVLDGARLLHGPAGQGKAVLVLYVSGRGDHAYAA